MSYNSVKKVYVRRVPHSPYLVRGVAYCEQVSICTHICDTKKDGCVNVRVILYGDGMVRVRVSDDDNYERMWDSHTWDYGHMVGQVSRLAVVTKNFVSNW